MNLKDKISSALTPLLVIFLGLVLLLSPDSASALVSNLLGWILIAVAIGWGISAVVSSHRRFGKVACSLVFAIAGGWLHQNPLLLAATLGRFCGIFLVVQGMQMFRRGLSLLRILVVAAGIGLILVPMSASRLLFSICGAVVIVIGIAMLFDLRKRPRIEDGDNDPFTVDPL